MGDDRPNLGVIYRRVELLRSALGANSAANDLESLCRYVRQLERQVTTLSETERDLRALVASLQRGDGA